MKVAVIGGGWAGLAAAVELTAGGASVTLLEAGRVHYVMPDQWGTWRRGEFKGRGIKVLVSCGDDLQAI